MLTTAKIIGYDGSQLLLKPDLPIDRELMQKNIGSVEIRLNDGRSISNEQRRKIFGIIRDIANWSGHDPDGYADPYAIRPFLQLDFCLKSDCECFSLSDVDMTTARHFLTYLIEFCFSHCVPTRDTLLNQTDDIGKYLYLCLEHRKCAICNKHAEVHHVDRIGMGRDREKIVHIGLKAIALCRAHHDEAHLDEKTFFEKYHVYGIKLDEFLCKCLGLNTKDRRL